MAAMVTAVPVSSTNNNVVPNNEASEQDEKYLYGENQDLSDKSNDAQGVEDIKVNGENIQEGNGEDDDGEFEESDDDDDDINVHIGEVNAAATNQYGTPGAWKKDGANGNVAAATTAATAVAGKPGAVGQKKIDVNAVGLINGQPIYEYDMDADQDEKPWKKPGADISDYFNYGFTEDTWKQYCEKQRRMRIESTRAPYTVAATGIQPLPPPQPQQQIELEVLPDGRTRIKAGPPPDRKVEGSIHVLGSDDARRKQKEEELLALALGSTRMMAPTAFPQQRMYTALPSGGLMYNPLGGPPGSQPDMTQPQPDSQNSSQGQQIQSLGAPSAMQSVMPPGLQYLPAGPPPVGMQLAPGGQPIFPPPNVGMDMGQDPFMHPGNNMLPPFGFPRPNSDSEFDSDGGSRRHRDRRESSRHRRPRDRSDRDRNRERSSRDHDRDRSRADHRDRSSSKRRHESSRSSSDKKKHSRSSSSRGDQDESGEKKSKRKPKIEIKEEPIDHQPDNPQEVAGGAGGGE